MCIFPVFLIGFFGSYRTQTVRVLTRRHSNLKEAVAGAGVLVICDPYSLLGMCGLVGFLMQ